MGKKDTAISSQKDSSSTVRDSAAAAGAPVSPLTERKLLEQFSSPIKLGREETDLYNPEDLSTLLFLKPSIDIFSLGPFGQKRGFSNWGRVGKGEEILYDGQTRAPIYLNYPQSSEADLTSLQFEQADSVFFFDHPLASFLSGAQTPSSIYLQSNSADVKQPLVAARMNKRNSRESPFSSGLQSTAIFDFQRPLGNKAFVRGIGSFKNSSATGPNDQTEVQNYHLSVENPEGARNHWVGGYELDRETGGIVPVTGIPDQSLSKNFRRDAFFFNMDGKLSSSTSIGANLRYQRVDQKILSDSTSLRRRVEERKPFFGISLNRESNRTLTKIYANGNATLLNQFPGQADDWQARAGGLWAVQLNGSTIFSVVGQLSDTRLESPKPEGWVGLSRTLGPHQTIFVTASSQMIYPSVFDRFFEPKTLTSYTELSNPGPPERSNRINFGYKVETRRFMGGFSVVAERGDNYLTWQNPSLIGSTYNWQPSFKHIEGIGGEVGFDFKFIGLWKGGYAYRDLVEQKDHFSFSLSALYRAYLRWTTPEIKPIKALSFRFVPLVNYFSGFIDDFISYDFSSLSYDEREATLVSLKTIGAVKNFNFFYEVENLFDRQYFLRGPLPQPGRSYFFGFNWQLWD